MKKNRIIKLKSEIENIFTNGKNISNETILLKFVGSNNESKFLFAVSAKKFKRSVDRNRIKRLMRESVSKININNKNIAVIYIGNGIPTYNDINDSILKLINKI